MNTIPSTFNEYEPNRTILWGRQQPAEYTMDVSVIMLNKNGSHLKMQTLENLLKCGFKSVVCIEPSAKNFNLNEISKKFPTIKFIVPLEEASEGVLINSAVAEIDSAYFLVLHDSFNITSGILSKNLAENITANNAFCIVPRLLNSSGAAIITNFSPSAHKGAFKVEQNLFVQDGLPTLYPFDFTGLYNRAAFIRLGGFDYTLTSSHWQNLDLALRAWLWNERIEITTKFQLTYSDEIPVEDSLPDLSYLRLYLKNILPKFRSDYGYVPHFSFLRFWFNSSCGFFEALRQFNDGKAWVTKNRFRFKKDIQYLIEHWTD